MTTEEALQTLAEEQRTMPARRAALVTKARAEGMTWRAIARNLDMTEFGVRRALLKASEASEGTADDKKARPGQ